MKKKLATILAASTLSIGILSVSITLISSNASEAKMSIADNEEATFSSIAWNNIDYASPTLMNEYEDSYIPKNGYCILISYNKNFNPVVTDDFAHTNLEYSSHILINGTPISEIEKSVARIYSGKLYIYFSDSEINYVNDYFRPTVEIEENTTMYGLVLPYNKFEYKYSIGANGKWENTTSSVRSNVSYSSIAWNNINYDPQGTSYPALAGKNGLLLQYSEVLSNNSSENNGVFVQNRNLKNTILGDKISLNGKLFKDIDDAEIRYFNQSYMWLYAPNMTIASGDRFAKIDIKTSPIFDKIIPDKSFYFVSNKWVDNLKKATYSSIAWNNVDYNRIGPNLNANGVPTEGYVILLAFNENLRTRSEDANTNMATSAYDIGSHLLINGVPCKDVSGAIVGSYVNQSHLYIYFPDSSISYVDSYDRPTVEIKKDCLLFEYLLPELRFEFCSKKEINGMWVFNPSENNNPFSDIAWNNIHYGDVFGDKDGLLLTFENNISNASREYNGNDLVGRNLAKTNLGKNIKLNDVSLSDIDGAELKYYHLGHLWIYAPNMTEANNGFKNAHIAFIRPTGFLDSILPSIEFVFKENLWHLSNEDVRERTSFTDFNAGGNNADKGNGYRDVILCFDQNFYKDSSKNNTNLVSTNAEFVNKVTLNGTPLKNVPGIYVIYVGSNLIHMMIREVDEAPTSSYPTTELYIPQDTHLFDRFINEVTFYLDSNTNKWLTAQNGTIIATLEEATFKTTGKNNQIVGMSFESRINKAMYDVQVRKYGIDNISIGTYIVPKINYKNSNLSSPIEYVNYNSPSSSTYLDIVNENKDFINDSTANTDGYYRYSGSMYNIKPSHYADGFIGIGYLKAGDRTYYGNISDNATTFYELLVQAYGLSLVDSSYFDSVISFNTTQNAYELNDVSVIANNHIVNYVKNGYYSLIANKDIKTIVIDGEPNKVNIRDGQLFYFAYYNGTIDFRNSLEMSKGIGEPIYELFPDNVNSNAILNTVENVSSLNQAYGSNAERIWLDLKGGLGVSNATINQCDENGEFRFDPDKVNRLHDYLNEFIEKGITELTLLVSGWANDINAPVFLKNGNWYSFSEASAIGGATFNNVIPNQTNESYNAWLAANENLAYKIAKEFPEFKYIEAINEIDGGGYKYSPTYVTNNVIPSISTVAKWSMDLCHSYSKGIRRANSSLRVMSPSFSCLDVDSTGKIHPYNTKNFISNCYSYIENSDDTYTNNWFQVMNLHPYVFPTKNNTGEDSIYLWNNTPNRYSPSSIDNVDYDADWLTYMNYIHNSIMANHNDAKKSIAITEFGFSDMNGTTDSSWKYINYNNRFNTIATNMMNKINSVNYIETLIWFRLFDFAIKDTTAFAGCFEANFGLVEEDKTLKELGKKMYQLWNNGSTDYLAITAYLSSMEGRE